MNYIINVLIFYLSLACILEANFHRQIIKDKIFICFDEFCPDDKFCVESPSSKSNFSS